MMFFFQKTLPIREFFLAFCGKQRHIQEGAVFEDDHRHFSLPANGFHFAVDNLIDGFVRLVRDDGHMVVIPPKADGFGGKRHFLAASFDKRQHKNK